MPTSDPQNSPLTPSTPTPAELSTNDAETASRHYKDPCTMMPIQSPAIPGTEFILWQGHDAGEQLRDFINAPRLCRHPHHSASAPHALLGALRYSPPDPDKYGNAGGDYLWKLSPGEILLAGSAALVLEDLPEFKRSAVEMIARAWRNGFVRLAADGQSDVAVEIPVRCSIYATAEACPCGMMDKPACPECRCSAEVMKRWDARIEHAIKCFQGIE